MADAETFQAVIRVPIRHKARLLLAIGALELEMRQADQIEEGMAALTAMADMSEEDSDSQGGTVEKDDGGERKSPSPDWKNRIKGIWDW